MFNTREKSRLSGIGIFAVVFGSLAIDEIETSYFIQFIFVALFLFWLLGLDHCFDRFVSHFQSYFDFECTRSVPKSNQSTILTIHRHQTILQAVIECVYTYI